MGPTILIASPQMHDPFFERAVVLVWHHDDNGAMGVIVNRPMQHRLLEVVDPPKNVDPATYDGMLVSWGGPVETTSGTVLTRETISEEEGWNVAGIGVTRSMDALNRLLADGEPVKLILGYAGWGPGQLDGEIESGSWLLTDCDESLVFSVAAEDQYDHALATLGLSANTVWMQPINE